MGEYLNKLYSEIFLLNRRYIVDKLWVFELKLVIFYWGRKKKLFLNIVYIILLSVYRFKLLCKYLFLIFLDDCNL